MNSCIQSRQNTNENEHQDKPNIVASIHCVPTVMIDNIIPQYDAGIIIGLYTYRL